MLGAAGLAGGITFLRQWKLTPTDFVRATPWLHSLMMFCDHTFLIDVFLMSLDLCNLLLLHLTPSSVQETEGETRYLSSSKHLKPLRI